MAYNSIINYRRIIKSIAIYPYYYIIGRRRRAMTYLYATCIAVASCFDMCNVFAFIIYHGPGGNPLIVLITLELVVQPFFIYYFYVSLLLPGVKTKP